MTLVRLRNLLPLLCLVLLAGCGPRKTSRLPALVTHMKQGGIHGKISGGAGLCRDSVDHVTLTLSMHEGGFKIVAIDECPSADAAKACLEGLDAGTFDAVASHGPFVMACNFLPDNTGEAGEVIKVFKSFPLP